MDKDNWNRPIAHYLQKPVVILFLYPYEITMLILNYIAAIQINFLLIFFIGVLAFFVFPWIRKQPRSAIIHLLAAASGEYTTKLFGYPSLSSRKFLE